MPVTTARRRLQESGTPLEESPEAIEQGVSVTFQAVYRTIIFIAVAWTLGTLCSKVGLPSLVGEIVTGFLLGPPLADFVPYPEAMVLIGNIGLIGLMLESGINIDVAQLKESGKRAAIMAFVGSVLPLAVGIGLGLWSGENIQSSVSIGASFAPSSFGVAAGALTSGEIINTPVGQMIVASSVVDDVLGLILLAIVEVFTYPDPRVIDYIIPFISSFGFLIVLGYSAVTWMPRIIEKRIMPLFSDKYREFAIFALMFFLLIAYMPLMHYSRASSLTGAFLAGLTFSQINSIHISFVNKGRHLLNWLLRIFFSATIGFQVPVTSFGDPYVLKWGGKFILAILIKMPLGSFVPRYKHVIADDFPYDPYWRDFWFVALSVACRGEFNFIIASFALGSGLINAKIYAAMVFAILIACVIGPVILTKVIRHYNNLSKAYLTGDHPIHRIGNTCDGYRPLFLTIQARTKVQVGLQDTFERVLAKAGLIVIDHRSFHTLGMDAVDITELFVQDTKVKVRVAQCFDVVNGTPVPSFRSATEVYDAALKSAKVAKGNETPVHSFRSATEAYDAALKSAKLTKENETPVPSFRSATEAYDAALKSATLAKEKGSTTASTTAEEFLTDNIVDSNACQVIEDRCNEIRQALIETLESHNDPDSYTINVSEWKPFSSGDEMPEMGLPNRDRARSYCLLNSHDTEDDENDDNYSNNSEIEKIEEVVASTRSRADSHISDVSVDALLGAHESPRHRRKMTEPDLGQNDLWDTDVGAQQACRQGHFMQPGGNGHFDVTPGVDADLRIAPVQRHHRQTSNASATPQYIRRESTRSSSTAVVNEIDDEAEHIKERLHGYVRQMTSPAQGHRRPTSTASVSLFHRRHESTSSNPFSNNETTEKNHSS
eukprot:CAMPEP_0202484456 /NCGR_PEP_ID=MMETSP1361-20130828/3533_1 /ASSEMBLY_ACC=CAM_ASM_000849 /TAXON_ID=210615 /ORGANISM="Staurosira complex sp., Strain CCMP2646" /LENGTH=887 /DNA_ID=CAMNT_0049113111 /DNA_START=176 /DNA_END=2839 /DNA_ORIENTATION=-